MVRYLLLGIVFVSMGAGWRQPVLRVSTCGLVRDPLAYNGKMVRVRAVTAPGPAFSLLMNCRAPYPHGIALAFTDEAPIKPPVPFKTRYDRDMKKFLHYLNAKREIKLPKGWVAPPWAYAKYCKITVTITGRFDAVSREDVTWGRGYGEAGEYPYRIVVGSVANPVAKECPQSSPPSK